MTDAYAANTTADEIILDIDGTTTGLDRQADAILAQDEDRAFARTESLREAIRQDAAQGRDWARDRVLRARDAVQEEPVKATLYALALGVVIGLLAAR